MLDLEKLCRKYKIKPRGIIHVGAHEGAELSAYQRMGIRNALFIEANPAVFERLNVNVGEFPGVKVANYAISNNNGMVTLHVTSMDQSSSILPLKLHKELYPDIRETHQIVVQSRKLDTLLEELSISVADFNLLNIDIQGAELLALQGSVNLLKNIDAINTEVNYDELYEGCALINQIDDFLAIQGFERVATTTPFHPSWGDAFYIKKHFKGTNNLIVNAKKTNNVSFIPVGGYGNVLFQRAAAKIFAECFNLNFTDTEIFNHNKTIYVDDTAFYDLITNKRFNILKNVEYTNFILKGYFQYSRIFGEYENIVLDLYKDIIYNGELNQRDICCHFRLGDFIHSECHDSSEIIHPKYYIDILRDEAFDNLHIVIDHVTTENEKKYIAIFDSYRPIIHNGNAVSEDIKLLQSFNKIVISNSTFSWWAAFLSRADVIYLPKNFGEFGIINVKHHGEHVRIYDVRDIGIRKQVKFTDYNDL